MSYTPTEWKAGDVVTSEKLNKLENGLANADNLSPSNFVNGQFVKYFGNGVFGPDDLYLALNVEPSINYYITLMEDGTATLDVGVEEIYSRFNSARKINFIAMSQGNDDYAIALTPVYFDSSTYTIGLISQCNNYTDVFITLSPTSETTMGGTVVTKANGESAWEHSDLNIDVVNENIAYNYNSSRIYTVGDTAIYEKNLYVCTLKPPSAGEWNPTYWTRASLEGAYKKKDFYVELTPTSTDYSGTMSKTVAAIYDAYSRGCNIIFSINKDGDTMFAAVTSVGTEHDVQYPSFNANVILNDGLLVRIWTGTTNDGTSYTYNTDLYELTPYVQT